MKKRLPLLLSFVLFLALCASAAYWGMQLFKPQNRVVASPPAVAQTEIPLDGAASLFGGKMVAAVASNFQLKGVLASHDSKAGIAVLVADGKPAQAVKVGQSLEGGGTVTEVHAQYVMLEEGGVAKRIDLPEAKGAGNSAAFIPSAPPPMMPPPNPAQMNVPNSGVPPAPPPNLHNATGLNASGIRIGEPNAGAMMGNNPGPEATPRPAMPSEPNGPPVAK